VVEIAAGFDSAASENIEFLGFSNGSA